MNPSPAGDELENLLDPRLEAPVHSARSLASTHSGYIRRHPLPSAATCARMVSTRASQLSLFTRALRSGLGPGSASAASTSAMNPAWSRPIRHMPSTSTSGIAVETTGSPAARYSRTLSGFAFNVTSLIGNGRIATSKPLL